MADEELNRPDQPEVQPEENSGNESFRDVQTEELTELFNQLKQQTTDILNELRARHAAPEGDEPPADWEGLFESYRAPYRSGKGDKTE